MIYLFFQPESVNFRHTGLIIMSDGYGGPEDYYRFPLFGVPGTKKKNLQK